MNPSQSPNANPCTSDSSSLSENVISLFPMSSFSALENCLWNLLQSQNDPLALHSRLVDLCYVSLMCDDIRHNNQGAFALTQRMKHHKDEFKFKLRGTRVKSKTDKPYILKPKDYSVQNGPYIPKCSPNQDR